MKQRAPKIKLQTRKAREAEQPTSHDASDVTQITWVEFKEIHGEMVLVTTYKPHEFRNENYVTWEHSMVSNDPWFRKLGK